MKCTKCGVGLEADARFCPECGNKVVTSTATANVAIAPMATSLLPCKLTVTEVTTEGPDSDDDMRVTVKFQVTNPTDGDWEYLEVRTQLLGGGGNPVEETRDTMEQTVSAGETADLEVGFYGIKSKSLGADLTKAQIVISLIACSLEQKQFGEINIPATPLDIVQLAPTEVGKSLKLHSISLWKSEPDSDKESRVELKLLTQNLTNTNLSFVNVIAEVTDKSGREVCDAGGSEEIRAGSVFILGTSSGFTKAKKLEGAKMALTVRSYPPVAAVITQFQGITIATEDATDETADDRPTAKWPFPTDGEAESDSDTDDDDNSPADSDESKPSRSGGSRNGVRTFYANMDWFGSAEQPENFSALPEAFPEAEALWRDDAEGNLERIIELLSPYVGARFIPGNLSGWEEIFADPSDGGEYEYEAVSVKVVGIDFSVEPIPLCKAEATFHVKVTDAFNTKELDEWQDNNARFTDAISFYWNIERNDDTEDLDFTYGDNQGVECIVTDETPD